MCGVPPANETRAIDRNASRVAKMTPPITTKRKRFSTPRKSRRSMKSPRGPSAGGRSEVGDRGFCSIRDVELAIDRCQMELHRVHGHAQAGSNLGVREPFCGE